VKNSRPRLQTESASSAQRVHVGATDEDLVTLTLSGNREAFEQLVRRHQRPLVNHLYRITGQRDGAYDLAQEVFIKVYISMASFDSRYRFTTWLYRIASNCAIDHRRKKKPQTCSINLPCDDPSDPGVEPAVPGSEPDPHEMLRLRELQGRLDQAVEALPSNYRHLILLRHRHYLRYDEIARATGLPVGTVKNRIFRARAILKRELSDLLDAEA
jgi:RNA polymerase sigma-70 factor (ECF subfamily)